MAFRQVHISALPGCHRRLRKIHRHASNLALAVTFALVMVLAFDLDRAGEGLIAVSQQPMIDLYKNMLE